MTTNLIELIVEAVMAEFKKEFLEREQVFWPSQIESLLRTALASIPEMPQVDLTFPQPLSLENISDPVTLSKAEVAGLLSFYNEGAKQMQEAKDMMKKIDAFIKKANYHLTTSLEHLKDLPSPPTKTE